MKLDLKIVCDQLTEAIGIKDNHKVAAVIDEEYDNEFLGWCLVRQEENGQIIPQLGTRVATIKELFENFYEKENC